MDLACPELFNHLVSLIRLHVAENDGHLKAFSAHHLMEALSICFRVDKDYRLCHLANIED